MSEIRDPFIDQIAAELKRPVRLDPRFDDRVMEALNAPDVIPLHPTRQARRPWLVRPWTVRVSPIGAFAAAAALVGVIAFGAWQLSPIDQVQIASEQVPDGLTPVANTGEEALVVHQFTYYQKGLQSISVVGDFNDWNGDSTNMVEVSPGVWTVSLRLRPDVYEYQFILNGKQRVTDPTMPQTSSDFGSPNSVVKVSAKVPR
ncbi:MAG TPA: isoamylase early set domain-containing protein [Gemmatimonadaceae bacterium]